MKKSPQMQKLEAMLRSSRLVAGGFMGQDSRSVDEIIADDLATLARLGYHPRQLAKRMRELTELSRPKFGNAVRAADNLEVWTDEHRGVVVCPWPHPAQAPKLFTTARRIDTGEQIIWSGLSIHLVEAHGFFQGRGSAFRLDPEKLVRVIFLQ